MWHQTAHLEFIADVQISLRIHSLKFGTFVSFCIMFFNEFKGIGFYVHLFSFILSLFDLNYKKTIARQCHCVWLLDPGALRHVSCQNSCYVFDYVVRYQVISPWIKLRIYLFWGVLFVGEVYRRSARSIDFEKCCRPIICGTRKLILTHWNIIGQNHKTFLFIKTFRRLGVFGGWLNLTLC